MAEEQVLAIPEHFRELTEKNVAQARAAYSQFTDAAVQATVMWMAMMPSNEMTSRFKVVHDQAIRFAKQNADATFAWASELAKAKDVQDALGIQGRYAQSQMEAYAQQAQELGQLMAGAAGVTGPRPESQ